MKIGDIDYVVLDEIAMEIGEGFAALAISFDIPDFQVRLIEKAAPFYHTTPAHLVLNVLKKKRVERFVVNLRLCELDHVAQLLENRGIIRI